MEILDQHTVLVNVDLLPYQCRICQPIRCLLFARTESDNVSQQMQWHRRHVYWLVPTVVLRIIVEAIGLILIADRSFFPEYPYHFQHFGPHYLMTRLLVW